MEKALFQIFNEKPDDSDEVNQPRVIDVDRMYTEYEDELNAIERAKMGPESLNLDEFEINLRSHRITGGIFQIDYVEQPLQDVKTDEGALLRTCNSILMLISFKIPFRTVSSLFIYSDSSGETQDESFSLPLSDATRAQAGTTTTAWRGGIGNKNDGREHGADGVS